MNLLRSLTRAVLMIALLWSHLLTKKWKSQSKSVRPNWQSMKSITECQNSLTWEYKWRRILSKIPKSLSKGTACWEQKLQAKIFSNPSMALNLWKLEIQSWKILETAPIGVVEYPKMSKFSAPRTQIFSSLLRIIDNNWACSLSNPKGGTSRQFSQLPEAIEENLKP